MCSVGCFGLGFILDMKGVSQRRRAQYGLATVVVLNLGVYIWSIIMQVQFDRNMPETIDWNSPLYARSFLPYFFVQTTGPLSQSYMYWLLSSFATDAQGEFSPPKQIERDQAYSLSQRTERCGFPIVRSSGSSHRIRHEHQDWWIYAHWNVSIPCGVLSPR